MVTAFVVGFVSEKQERRQSAATDPTRYSATERDTWLGEGASLVKVADRPFLSLVAPGVDVTSVGPGGIGHWQGSGTSYAVEFVAGTAALVRAYRPC